MTAAVDLKPLAADLAARFESATRADGTSYARIKADRETPELIALIMRAHEDGALLPDDWRWEFIRSALEAIAEDGDDARMEPSDYTANLTAWLASDSSRLAYLEDVLTEALDHAEGQALYRRSARNTAFELLQLAYLREQDEVFSSVYSSLVNLAGEA